MSNKSFYSEAQAVLQLAGRIRFTVTENALADSDVPLVQTWLVCQSQLVYDLNLPDPSDAATAYKRWLGGLKELDLFAFGTFQKQLSALIRAYPATYEAGERYDRLAFKQQVTCRTFWGFISPVYEVLDNFLDCPCTHSLKSLLQWVDFSIKMNLRSADYSKPMLADYYQQEQEMGDWEYPPDIISELNEIIVEWFGDFSYAEFRPQHGPHSVADYSGRYIGTAAKYAAFCTDARLEYFLKKLGVSIDEYYPASTGVPRMLNANWRCSELVLVAKSMVTNRSISKEPAVLQFIQQGIRRCIRAYVRQHAFLKSVIDFEDQSKSAAMVRYGSIFGDFASIDLSAASDSVALKLVKQLFRRTLLLIGLIASRSDYTVTPDGTRVKLNKFAPMGSAVCFDIETVVFAAVCEYARRKTHSKTKFRVFGDDIVVPREYEALVIEVLEALHFRVNKTKSYYGTQLCNFREACGGEFYNGTSVVPIRISRSLCVTSFVDLHKDEGGSYQYVKVTSVEYSSQIGFLNRLCAGGLYSARRAAIWLFRGRKSFDLLWRKTICDDQGGRFGIACRPGFCDNFHITWRRHADLACFEYLAADFPLQFDRPKLKAVEAQLAQLGMCADDVRYTEWLRRSQDPRQKLPGSVLTEALVVTLEETLPTRHARSSRVCWRLDPEH